MLPRPSLLPAIYLAFLLFRGFLAITWLFLTTGSLIFSSLVLRKLKTRKVGSPLRPVQKGQSKGEECFLDVHWKGLETSPFPSKWQMVTQGGRDSAPSFRQGLRILVAAFCPGACGFLGVPQESSKRETVELIITPDCCLAALGVLTLFPLAQVFILVLDEHIVIMLIMLLGSLRLRGRGVPLLNCFLSWSSWLSAWVPT